MVYYIVSGLFLMFSWCTCMTINVSVQYKALNTSDFFGFRFFGFHFENGLSTDETYSRRQINTGTKFEVSHLHNIFVDIGQSGPSMD